MEEEDYISGLDLEPCLKYIFILLPKIHNNMVKYF